MKKNEFDLFDYINHQVNKDTIESEKDAELYKLTYSKLILTYLIGGLVGTIWEVCLTLYRHHHFEFRNGSFYTPFNFVYGCGLVAIIIFLHKLHSTKQIFCVGAVVGGVAEYTLSFLQETLLGTRSWDYSNRFLNINGRTTLPYCIFWGIGCVLIMKIVFPLLFKIINKIPVKTMNVIAYIATAVIIFDVGTTAGALFRYSERMDGIEAKTFLGRYFDARFPNKRVELFFPNMKKV